jgi:hypothetical protein
MNPGTDYGGKGGQDFVELSCRVAAPGNHENGAELVIG